MTSQCCYDVNVAATAAMTSPAATAEYSAESDEVTNAAEGASAKCTSRECQRHEISGVLGGIRGYTPYTNLPVFSTAYTHLSDHK